MILNYAHFRSSDHIQGCVWDSQEWTCTCISCIVRSQLRSYRTDYEFDLNNVFNILSNFSSDNQGHRCNPPLNMLLIISFLHSSNFWIRFCLHGLPTLFINVYIGYCSEPKPLTFYIHLHTSSFLVILTTHFTDEMYSVKVWPVRISNAAAFSQ